MLAGWQQIDWDLDVDITYVTNLSPFVPWDVQTYPNESSLSDEQLRNLIVQIVTAEGPMICSRLYDLVFEPRGPGLRVDSTSLSTAGRAFGTDVLPRSSRSAEGSRTRPSTSRAKIHAFFERWASDAPTVEIEVHVEHARPVLGLAQHGSVCLMGARIFMGRNPSGSLQSVLGEEIPSGRAFPIWALLLDFLDWTAPRRRRDLDVRTVALGGEGHRHHGAPIPQWDRRDFASNQRLHASGSVYRWLSVLHRS
jgi:hypothetical protein